jgi:hypothetical protein
MKWYYKRFADETEVCPFLDKLTENGVALENIKITGLSNWSYPVVYYLADKKIID